MRQYSVLFILMFLFILGLSACSTSDGQSEATVNNTHVFEDDNNANSPPITSSDDDAGVIEQDVFVETDSGNTEEDVRVDVVEADVSEADAEIDVVEDIEVDVVEDVASDTVENDTLQSDVEEDAEADVVEADTDVDPDANTEPDAEEDVSDFCLANERRLRDLDDDGYGDPNNAILIGVCEPWEDEFVIWQEGQDDCNDGNANVHPEATEVCGDGIDQDCNGVDEECPDHGSLRVDISHRYASKQITKGANASVLAIDLTAGSGEDIYVRNLVVFGQGDSIADGHVVQDENFSFRDYVSRCDLINEETGDFLAVSTPGFPHTTSVNTSGFLFSRLNQVILAGTSVRWVVDCNFSNSSLDNNDDDEYFFQVLNVEADVSAETLTDGSAVIPTGESVGVNNDQEILVRLTDHGDVIFEISPNTPTATIVLGDSTGVVVGRFIATATGEDVRIRRLYFQNSVTTDAGEEDVNHWAVREVHLLLNGEVLATTFVDSETGDFDFGVNFVMTQGTTIEFTVTIDTSRVPEDTESGTRLGFVFQSVNAIGMTSGENIAEVEYDLYTSNFVLRKTKPTIYLASGSPYGSAIPSHLEEVLRFNVAASARGFVGLQEVVFQVTSSDNAESGWNTCQALSNEYFWDLADFSDRGWNLSQDLAWYSSLGEPCYDHPNDPLGFVVMSLNEEISAGETKTYSLRANASGASSVADDIIRIDITRGADNALGRDILWSDDNYADGIDGQFIRNLPVVGGVLVF